MANPYYPPRASHFGGPAMRYDGSQQPGHYQNPYSRQQEENAQSQNARRQSYGQQNQYQHQQGNGGAGGYYDPYASAAPAAADPNFSRVSLSDRAPLEPPNPGFASRANGNAPMGYPQRPDSPGIYPDRAPNWEKLTPAQVKIAKTFPKDLDEEPKSMLQSSMDTLRRWRDFIKWKYWYYYLVVLIIVALTVLMTLFHRQIIDWLTPFSKKVKSVSWGWVIPVIIFVVISFPPLFGHEILAILCGVVYGLWIGFAVVCLGTLLGEIANFYAFKTFLSKHAEKYERKNISYGCMAHIVREGGFKVILLARLSAIPGHFTTAVFATVGMSIWMFTLAAVLSLPKQLSIVYLGVAIEQSVGGTESTSSQIVKYVVLLLSLVITVWAAHYLYAQMEKARPQVQQTLRAKRFTLLSEARKTDAALTNTDDYDRPPTASSGEPGERTKLSEGGDQPRWNRWSQSHNRPRNDAAEMQQLPYNHNTATSTSRLVPNAEPLSRLDSRVSDVTADGGPDMGNPATMAGSTANLNYGNASQEHFGAQQQQYPVNQRAQHTAPPQLRVNPQARAPMDDQSAQSPTDMLLPASSPKRASRYQYQSNIGSIYSLQPSGDDGTTLSPTRGQSPHPSSLDQRGVGGAMEHDGAGLPGYTSMPPRIEEENVADARSQQPYSNYQSQPSYQQQQQEHQFQQQQQQQQQQQEQQQRQQLYQQQQQQQQRYYQQQQQQQQQHQQQQQPEVPSYQAGNAGAYQQPGAGSNAWQSPPIVMQHDLGERRWAETSPQTY